MYIYVYIYKYIYIYYIYIYIYICIYIYYIYIYICCFNQNSMIQGHPYPLRHRRSTHFSVRIDIINDIIINARDLKIIITITTTTIILTYLYCATYTRMRMSGSSTSCDKKCITACLIQTNVRSDLNVDVSCYRS